MGVCQLMRTEPGRTARPIVMAVWSETFRLGCLLARGHRLNGLAVRSF